MWTSRANGPHTEVMPPVPLPSDDSSAVFNGQATSKYSWSQTITELEVKIPVQPHIVKGKQVVVEIGRETLKVFEVKQVSSQRQLETLVFGDLTFPVVTQDSYWTLSPGKYLSVFLQKKQERWWTALLDGEPDIDLKNIEASRDMSELPDDEQMKIQEMMYNQEQKVKGLPTSDEQKMHKILKQAWDKEGSPFKGTEFDPSLVSLGSSDNGP